MSLRSRAALVAVAAGAALALSSCSDGATELPETAATVGGTEIPSSAVATQAVIISQNPDFGQEFAEASDDERARQANALALSQLIFEAILTDGADELGVEVTDADVAETTAELTAQFGGEDEMYAQLEEQGLDRDEVDRQIAMITLQDAVMAELSPEVSDEAVEEAYQEGTPARHILVETEDEAAAVYARIVDDGEDFADVATETSIDGSAQNGGDLGFVQPGMTVPPFEDALFAADEGEVVGPVESDFGFHVIERLEKPPIDEVEEELRSALDQQSAQGASMAFQQFITERMEAADVQVDPAYGRWDPVNGHVVLDDDDAPEPEQPDAPPAPDAPDAPDDEPADD